MRITRRSALAGAASLAFAGLTRAVEVDPALQTLIDGPQRSDKNRARDKYRHPAEVLSFFGVRPDSVVVEIMPGAGGYWTEILAPYLRDKGQYIAANAEPTSDEAKRDNEGFAAKMAGSPDLYGKVETSVFAADRFPIAAPSSADYVLTFRNLHNWMAHGEAEASLKAFYAALKTGGALGIEDHRGKPDQPQDPLAKSGYVRQDFAVQLAEAAGFRTRCGIRGERQPEGHKRLCRRGLGATADLPNSRIRITTNMPRSAKATAGR